MKKRVFSITFLIVIIIMVVIVFACMLILAIMNLQKLDKNEQIDEAKKTIEDTNILAELVEVGDFIWYDAGKWDEEEINALGDVYQEEPKEQGKFGGFKIGDNRNNSIDEETQTSTGKNRSQFNGWRVLKIVDENNKKTETKEDDSIYIIHAGISEKYYHEEGKSNDTEDMLTKKSDISNNSGKRNWNMYINSDYAVSATIFTKRMLDEWGESRKINTEYNNKIEDDLIKISSSYWLGEAFNDGFIWRISQNGNVLYYSNDALGIRPVVRLKKGLKTSGLVEKVVGTDGITKEMVWNLE